MMAIVWRTPLFPPTMHTQGCYKMKEKHYRSTPFTGDSWYLGIHMQFWLFRRNPNIP